MTTPDRITELEAANRNLEEQLRVATEALTDFRDNWDCDSDGHKYKTGCRVCAGEEALAAIERVGEEG